uniref:Sugar transport protein 13-like n=1 Tax=Nicotiana tabacum TaxID=4097 RepID=A0A1S4DBS4_TOBAC|nr:PREDICTED: sugar transport protein 13-like [Nicotiana tabacum]
MAASHNFRYGWRRSFASNGFLVLPLLVLSFFVSETSWFLIMKGRMHEEIATLKMMRKCGAEAELQLLVGLMENDSKRKRKKLSHSPLLLLNIVAQIFQQVLGLYSILFFGPLLLQSARYTYNASFAAPLIAGVIRAGVAGLIYPSYIFLDRRKTLVSACLVMILAHVSLLGLFRLIEDHIFQLSQKSACVGMEFSIPLIGGYSMFLGPSEWTEESYVEEIRALGACWEAIKYLLMSLIMNPAVSPLFCALKAWIFMPFCCSETGIESSWFLIKKGSMDEEIYTLKMMRKCEAEEDLQLLAGFLAGSLPFGKRPYLSTEPEECLCWHGIFHTPHRLLFNILGAF